MSEKMAILLAGIVAVGLASVVWQSPIHPETAVKQDLNQALSFTLSDLLRADKSLLASRGIGFLNLLCAHGLPGTENCTLAQAQATLDTWEARVKSETERYFLKYRQNPGEFNSSEAYYRILTLLTVIQQDFHVRYLEPVPKVRRDRCDWGAD